MDSHLVAVDSTVPEVEAFASVSGTISPAAYWANMVERFEAKPLGTILLINTANGLALTGVGFFLLPFYFKEDMGLSPGEAQLWVSLLILGFACKPLMGIITDSAPLRGYKLKSYIRLGSFIGTAGLLILTLLPAEPTYALFGLMMLSLGSAWTDLLANAYGVSVARRCSRPTAAEDIAIFGVSSFGLAGAFGVCICAAIYFYLGSIRPAFFISAVAQASIMLAADWVTEERTLQKACPLETTAITKAWTAIKPSGPSEGVVMQCLVFLLLSISLVPDTSQALFAYYVATDVPEWSAVPVDKEPLLINCAWVSKHENGMGCQNNNTELNISVTQPSGSMTDLGWNSGPIEGQSVLWQVAQVNCPLSCGQCSPRKTACLSWSPIFLGLINFLSALASGVAGAMYDRMCRLCLLTMAIVVLRILVQWDLLY